MSLEKWAEYGWLKAEPTSRHEIKNLLTIIDRDLIAMKERHLKRLLSEYLSYYHEDRTHLGLAKGTPLGRPPSGVSGRIVSHERVGGLHHRYDRAA